MQLQTIQKLSENVGIDTSYIRKMIKDKVLTPYKMDGYKRIYIDLDEFNSNIKPVFDIDSKIDLEKYLI
ncbi:MAG: hypothetical protein OQK48_07845 [Sulfurimonas sp.]|uniref:hypothetical protein n=1 Tax=Sulfurimonas sp. TaxID=2022749 RepID=UPI0026133384|nr:hypothetical protein [Sulfurimonas sp.]MCW8895194.1 hypothetical protein [Sulfurimonas sp.]MCW8954845.1 hypothetical protein [Sulfurimonas sp.]MCW9068440.1 hypothetical protein [Sulfurimonas sp.]